MKISQRLSGGGLGAKAEVLQEAEAKCKESRQRSGEGSEAKWRQPERGF
jgi:hypothetical protein